MTARERSYEAEFARAVDALQHIPADCDYETYFKVLAALHSEFGDDAKDAARTWASQGEKFEPQEFNAKWRSLKGGAGYRIGTLYAIAKEWGFNPREQDYREPTPAEMEALRIKREEMARKAREAEEQDARDAAKARKHGAEIIRNASAVGPGHPQLEARKVTATETLLEIPAESAARILGYTPKQNGEPLEGRLLVAPLKADQFVGVELRDEKGRKSLPHGTAPMGAYWATRKLPENADAQTVLVIGEGVVSVLSMKAAWPEANCIAARTANNLQPVAERMRQRFPDAQIIIAGEQGGGLRAAQEAARAVGGRLAVFPVDANDTHQREGLEAVRKALAAAQAPTDAPEAQPIPDNAPGAILAAPVAHERGEDWPEPLDPAAFHGLAGEIVQAIAPYTESDPAAILLQLLTIFGANVGRGPHFMVESSQHPARLFSLIVGRSSKARKGTSLARVEAMFEAVPNRARKVEGLSSGEGLKWAVRDPIRKVERDKHGALTETETDAGVTDKRLLVVEGEFAQVLRNCARQGNTLSSVIRSTWDSGNLQTLTKNDPCTATGAHVCVAGHITEIELRAELTATDQANGFANRFLYMAAERSQYLPFGGKDMPPDMLRDFGERIAKAIEAAQYRRDMNFSREAAQLWEGLYRQLSEGHPGLLGSVTGRAEAQVLRLSLIYALLDCSGVIELPHLQAALAVWERCEATARYLFGSALGDRVADAILRALKAAPNRRLTRTQISALFHKNEPAEKIAVALRLLEDRRFAKVLKSEGPGRPTEIWEAA